MIVDPTLESYFISTPGAGLRGRRVTRNRDSLMTGRSILERVRIEKRDNVDSLWVTSRAGGLCEPADLRATGPRREMR